MPSPAGRRGCDETIAETKGCNYCSSPECLMPDETVTLSIDGDVSLQDFASATAAFSGLLQALTESVAPGSGVEWFIEHLDSGSAVMTARAETGTDEEVERISVAYVSVGRSLSAFEPIPYSPETNRYAGQLVSLIDGRIPRIGFENSRETQVVERPASLRAPIFIAPAPQPLLVSRGAVEGVIQTLSNRRGLRFTLYDSVFDKAVSCYLRREQEPIMRDSWGRRAYVEGTVTRAPATGRPLSIRQITAVEVIPDREAGTYRRARAIAPGGTESPENRIRRLRDAE